MKLICNWKIQPPWNNITVDVVAWFPKYSALDIAASLSLKFNLIIALQNIVWSHLGLMVCFFNTVQVIDNMVWQSLYNPFL